MLIALDLFIKVEDYLTFEQFVKLSEELKDSAKEITYGNELTGHRPLRTDIPDRAFQEYVVDAVLAVVEDTTEDECPLINQEIISDPACICDYAGWALAHDWNQDGAA